MAEVVEDPQVIAREMIVDVDCPGKGEVKIVRPPITSSGMIPRIGFAAPSLGEHTGEILKDTGYSKAGIDQLVSKGIILPHA